MSSYHNVGANSTEPEAVQSTCPGGAFSHCPRATGETPSDRSLPLSAQKNEKTKKKKKRRMLNFTQKGLYPVRVENVLGSRGRISLFWKKKAIKFFFFWLRVIPLQGDRAVGRSADVGMEVWVAEHHTPEVTQQQSESEDHTPEVTQQQSQSENHMSTVSTVQYSTVLYCTVLYCTALYCTLLNSTGSYFTAQRRQQY